MSSSSLIACHECDALQREIALSTGGLARCIRCGVSLYRCPFNGLNRSLAFTFCAGVVFLLANIYPLMTLEVRGVRNTTTLFNAVHGLYGQGQPLVASLMLVTAILVPAANIAGRIYLLLPLWFGRIPRRFATVFRLVQAIRPWDMTEVVMLAILVTLVKLADIGDVALGIGFWALGGLMLLLTAGAACFESHILWERVAAIERTGRTDAAVTAKAGHR